MDNGNGDDGDANLVADHAAGSIIPVLLADFRNANGDGERFSCLVRCTSSW